MVPLHALWLPVLLSSVIVSSGVTGNEEDIRALLADGRLFLASSCLASRLSPLPE